MLSDNIDMDSKTAKKYLLGKPESIEDYPFGSEIAVFKVRNKMFATLGNLKGVPAINLKCDPDEALILRDIFTSVIPGYHMNKRHWNTIYLDASIPKGEIERMIDNSFLLVIKGMPKTDRDFLKLRYKIDGLEAKKK